jgi:hypothetical protein
LPELRGKRRYVWVEEHRYTSNRGRDKLERLQPFAADGELEAGEAGEMAAGAGEIRHETAADRIGHLYEHDRYRQAVLS